MTDQELLALNQKGFIPGPDETEMEFQARVHAAETFFRAPPAEFQEMDRVPQPHWDWVSHHLQEIYDFKPHSIVAFYSNRKLAPWQGAASWIIDSKPGPLCVVQLRKGFRKGSFLRLYSRDEILAHEAVHAARCAFQEPKNEEFFAYFTSSARWRRVLGPILRRPWEALLFLTSTAIGAVIGNFIPPTILLTLALTRLIRQHIRFNKASKNLMARIKDKKKIRAILFRLTDKEIEELSQGRMIEDDQTIRFRTIRLAYF
ncbi:MAG: hypothetical protein JSS32_01020 [Verrucomicrobia bacterium]|nr:hypothetical protein [Verrucomicrobiota bacterium]